MSQPPPHIFRQEALEHHARPEARGSLLQLAPTWTRVTYWLVVALALVLGVGLALVDVNDYARGPVLIRVKGLQDVTATAGGRVSRVLVTPGQQVRAGQALVELYASEQEAERERVAQEFRAQLAAQLLEPLNAGTRQSLASLRAQLELSNARLEERVLKAPCDGRVSDVRVQQHRYLTPGEVVASILQEGAEAWAVALLPGQYRPMLHPGQPLRVELNGFAYAYQNLQVATVSDELVGATELRRYLGPHLGDVVNVEGSRVVAEAPLPGWTFQSDGRTYSYYNGMPGNAWVRVRPRNGWMTLLPVLELLERRRE